MEPTRQASSETTTSAQDLTAVRDLLVKPRGGRSRLVGPALREALTSAFELQLTRHAGQSGVDGRGIALLAVGALGRRDMMPYSDLDLVLVHDGQPKARMEKIAEELWYPMWDAGIGLDHSVRTPAQAIKVAATDLRTALGLLEARYLAGDEDLAQQVIGKARSTWRTGLRGRAAELVESTRQRWASAGEVASRAEPDLKHGRGGLRDVQVLEALAMAQVIDRPGEEVAKARDLLLDVRAEVHRCAGRARDVLRAQDGDDVAHALGMTDKFALAGALSGAGRTIAYAMDVALRSTTPGRSRIVRSPLDEGVVRHGDEVALAKKASPSTDPALLLRVASASAREGIPIAAGTLSTLADRAPEPHTPWPEAVRHQLSVLLGAGDGLADVIEALDRTGLWGRLFPEWGAVRDLPPRDAPHVYTVDRHLISTCVHAADLTTTVTRPDLLLLGALIHDIGKGRGEDHSIVGARLATQIGERMGLPPADVRTLSMMVRHHLLLPHTATRRDVQDPVTVRRIAETVEHDVVLLELLAALSQADSLATGPGVWSQWKAELIGELVAATRRAIEHEVVPVGQQQLDDAEYEIARRSKESGRVELDVRRSGDLVELLVAAPDRPGELSRTCGVLVLAGLRIHSCSLSTVDTTSVITCTVSPRFGSEPDTAALREQLRLAERGAVPIADRIEAKERDYARGPRSTAKPVLLWFDDEASGGAVLEVRAVDEIGLLYRITAVLERYGTDIRWARAATLGPTTVSSFCLLDAHGQAPAPEDRAELERALTAMLG